MLQLSAGAGQQVKALEQQVRALAQVLQLSAVVRAGTSIMCLVKDIRNRCA